MIRTHRETKAEITIAALPVAEQEATSCGIMRIDPAGQVTDFVEKPKTPEALARVRTDPAWLERFGIRAGDQILNLGGPVAAVRARDRRTARGPMSRALGPFGAR